MRHNVGKLRRFFLPDSLTDQQIRRIRDAAFGKPTAQVDEVLARWGLAGRLRDDRAFRRELKAVDTNTVIGYLERIGREPQLNPSTMDHCHLCGRAFTEREPAEQWTTIAVFHDTDWGVQLDWLGWMHIKCACLTSTLHRGGTYPAEIPEYTDGALAHPAYWIWWRDYNDESGRIARMPTPESELPTIPGRKPRPVHIHHMVVGDIVYWSGPGSVWTDPYEVSAIENDASSRGRLMRHKSYETRQEAPLMTLHVNGNRKLMVWPRPRVMIFEVPHGEVFSVPSGASLSHTYAAPSDDDWEEIVLPCGGSQKKRSRWDVYVVEPGGLSHSELLDLKRTLEAAGALVRDFGD